MIACWKWTRVYLTWIQFIFFLIQNNAKSIEFDFFFFWGYQNHQIFHFSITCIGDTIAGIAVLLCGVDTFIIPDKGDFGFPILIATSIRGSIMIAHIKDMRTSQNLSFIKPPSPTVQTTIPFLRGWTFCCSHRCF